MSESEPLLKSKSGVLQLNSESKIFFTADELLQHVRSKYKPEVSRPHKLEGFAKARSTSTGCYVDSQLTSHDEYSKEDSDATNAGHLRESKLEVNAEFRIKQRSSISQIKTVEQHLHQESCQLHHDKIATEIHCHPENTPSYGTLDDENEIPSTSHAVCTDQNKQRNNNRIPTGDLQKGVNAINNNSALLTPDSVALGREKIVESIKDVHIKQSHKMKISYQLQGMLESKEKDHDESTTTYMDYFKVTVLSKKMVSNCYMASLQSPRTQCCCCAVGVFAAMFGIFMLSAGICIVLNVTFMEVDTSGLPPNLHNESGKKVVGIILICVAIAFLGLSATVSVVYFTLCSRKSQAAITAAHSNSHQHKHKTLGTFPGQERPGSRGSVSSGKSSLASTSNFDAAKFPKVYTSGRPDYKKKHKQPYRGRKNAVSRNILPPHEEEDPESPRSSLELGITNETYSNQGRILETTVRNEEMIGASSMLVITSSSRKAPMIVVDYFNQNDAESVKEDLTESHLNGMSSVFDDDSVSNACSELYDSTAATGRDSPYDTVETSFTNWSSLRSHELDVMKDSELQLPPDLPHNIDVSADLSTLNSFPLSASLSSNLELHNNILKVMPASAAGLGSPSSSCATLNMLVNERKDQLQDLPHIRGHQNEPSAHHYNSENDSMNESRSSFNSAFSFDGNDPDQTEMDKLQKTMDKLLHSNTCD